MKKIICLLLILAMIFSMAACGKGSDENTLSPSATMDAFLQALKAQDFEAAQQYYEGELTDLSSVAEDLGATPDTELSNYLIKKMLDFDYTIDNEQVDGKKASVDVSFKTYDMSQVMQGILSSLMSEALGLVSEGMSDEEIAAKVNELMLKKFKKSLKSAEKDHLMTITLPLVKKDGKWLVKSVEHSLDFTNAISGGLLEFLKSAGDILG